MRMNSRHWFLPPIPRLYTPERYKEICHLCWLCGRNIMDPVHFTTTEFEIEKKEVP